MLQKHLAQEQTINPNCPLIVGNHVELLQDGPETYKSMLAAIAAAKDHINLETYIFDEDEVGNAFAELMIKKQSEGVTVNLIYDSVGCLNTPGAFFERLRDAGIHVLEFNPINPLSKSAVAWELNNRDHRKLLVVDGAIAFVGGINISAVYSSNPLRRHNKKATGWRDTHAKITGPVVAEFQKLFIASWQKQAGPELAPQAYFPELQTTGIESVRAIGYDANESPSPIYFTLISAIAAAEVSVHLTVAYFAPDPKLLAALKRAARRGVNVQLVMPNASDSWPLFYLGRSYYRQLLKAGVKIYERLGPVMHAKTASIDGVWSTIGSSNLDWRSFIHNDEINAVILGAHFSRQMDAMFAEDIKESTQIDLRRWKKRSLLMRFKEWTARLGAYWL